MNAETRGTKFNGFFCSCSNPPHSKIIVCPILSAERKIIWTDSLKCQSCALSFFANKTARFLSLTIRENVAYCYTDEKSTMYDTINAAKYAHT